MGLLAARSLMDQTGQVKTYEWHKDKCSHQRQGKDHDLHVVSTGDVMAAADVCQSLLDSPFYIQKCRKGNHWQSSR
jgi:hypothetical protein